MPEAFTPNQWIEAESRVRAWYPDFYRNLQSLHPTLSAHEIKLCTLLLLKYDRNSIAEAFDISPESVGTGSYRLRKHLELDHEEILLERLLKIAIDPLGGGGLKVNPLLDRFALNIRA